MKTIDAMKQAIAALNEAQAYTSCASFSPSVTREIHKAAENLKVAIARDAAEVSPPDIDDRAYWDHEIAAFQRAYAELEDGTHPAPPPSAEREVAPTSGEREALIARLRHPQAREHWVDTEGMMHAAADMLAADAQQVAVPQGWKLVPVEPTDEMSEAAWSCSGVGYVGEREYIHRADLAYKAMLAAAPQPPQGDKP